MQLYSDVPLLLIQTCTCPNVLVESSPKTIPQAGDIPPEIRFTAATTITVTIAQLARRRRDSAFAIRFFPPVKIPPQGIIGGESGEADGTNGHPDRHVMATAEAR
ncbi:hypothetical protein Ato02nite_066030 [Paractinoplanes toevensis]|uniref:Uncharacterized protein n=1 Tax=Paractinoplanes toevensis TaxID=571911 RepID=A0A919TI58_9ACTN|nr:hypothetical protein Ato02nite_066030 [Actinoplanes toevensis]